MWHEPPEWKLIFSTGGSTERGILFHDRLHLLVTIILAWIQHSHLQGYRCPLIITSKTHISNLHLFGMPPET